MSRNPSSDPQVPSASSHRLSSAASPSVPSRKSSSAVPTTSSASPPRTHISPPAPSSVPLQNYRSELVRRFSRDKNTSHKPLTSASTSPPEYAVTEEEYTVARKRSTRPSHTDSIRRASYTAAIFRQLEEEGMSNPTGGQQWSPGVGQDAVTGTTAANVSTGHNHGPGSAQAHNVAIAGNDASQPYTKSSSAATSRRPSRSRMAGNRIINGRRQSNDSPGEGSLHQGSENGRATEDNRPQLGTLGVCALDSKARSKPSRNILNRINAHNEFEVVIFGDKVILDEEPKDWPVCDYLIAFFSDGFPLHKAIEYAKLRKPFSVNDLSMQMVLWDRRLCLYILDRFEVATPPRLEVTRDGGPRVSSVEMARHIYDRTGLRLPGPSDGTGGGAASCGVVKMLDNDTLYVDGKTIKKPFVEKPVSGEDHNIRIYYSSDVGGGGRRLFRKINNKSSDADNTLSVPRSITEPDSSYIYESFLSTSNHEDVKAYTVGSGFCHAETRKSPVVDGIVKRNAHGKEMRYVTSLTRKEAVMASRISEAFGQRICGFDLLRVGHESFVIDVNGWSFVKDNNEYYDRCARILKDLFTEEKQRRDGRRNTIESEPGSSSGSPNGHQPSSTHFQRMKSILKSPSMGRSHRGHGRTHRNSTHASPEGAPRRAPSISTGPSQERADGRAILPGSALEPDTMMMPPPAVNGKSKSVADTHDGSNETEVVPPPAPKSQWKLKGMVAVIRHADRTPKQKLKFTFHTQPFVDLLKGHKEEVLLAGEPALENVMCAVRIALREGEEDEEKLRLLLNTLLKKAGLQGTKVQIKPMFRKSQDKGKKVQKDSKQATKPNQADSHAAERPISHAGDLKNAELSNHVRRQGSVSGITMSREAAAEDNLDFEKLQLILKWGGEPTHSARYQSQELGENMRNDLLLMNRNCIDDLAVYSSSERRSTTSAQMWTASFLNKNEVPTDYIQIRKDILDDSNAAKDETDKVKKKLKTLLRKGHQAPPQFAWPENMPEPYIVAHNVVELMKFHRVVLRDNFKILNNSTASASLTAAAKANSGSKSPRLGVFQDQGRAMTKTQAVGNIQNRWCSGEDADLFKERWEKLFDEFCDPDKVDPSKISELHDTMKYDALHNRQFLEWIFAPSPELLQSYFGPGVKTPDDEIPPESKETHVRSDTMKSQHHQADKPAAKEAHERTGTFPHFFRKRAFIDPNTVSKSISEAAAESYFNLFKGVPRPNAKTDQRLEKLRELFLYTKVLFDYVGPQEYGILDSEKLEIGLLTSLPLLRAIVNDLEDMQASEGAKTSAYFTKESHIYTLLNCIIEGGVNTKIERNKIPELDYLSTISFELYESANMPHPPASASSIRTSASDTNATQFDSQQTAAMASSDKLKSPSLGTTDDAFNYSIRITISPGCHTFEPLDVQLDSRHTIGFAQRRSLTAHNDYRSVIETLRDKFHTVKLPKSFVAVNLSEKVPQAFIGPKEEDAANQSDGDEMENGEEKVDADKALGISLADEKMKEAMTES
ncbi:MAG: hypothetical protein Q9159_002153 [Coniocarpon cinnabarinum]